MTKKPTVQITADTRAIRRALIIAELRLTRSPPQRQARWLRLRIALWRIDRELRR